MFNNLMKFSKKYDKLFLKDNKRQLKMKNFLHITLGIILFLSSTGLINAEQAVINTNTTSVKNAVSPRVTNTYTVKSLDVVKNPTQYLNKIIVMNATFDKFSTLGLDYKPAMRNSQDYIGILIKRDDVIDHTVPLSEMKMFLKRDLAEKNINLESDDKIQITGKVFSAALGDPWVDITDIKILKKADKANK